MAVREVAEQTGIANFIFGALFIAFVIYITAKGELGTYLQMFFYSNPVSPTPATDASTAAVNALYAPTSGSQAAIASAVAANQPLTGSQAAIPNIAPGQNATLANSWLNGIFGVPSSIMNAIPNQQAPGTQPQTATGGIGLQ